jgi:signal transduction histidine kinase
MARDSAGFGLGLWIVGRMVAAHHGSIVVADGPKGGALFRVILPNGQAAATDQDHRT